MPNQYPEIYTQFFANIIIGLMLIVLVVSILFLYQKKRISKEKEIASIKVNHEQALLQTRLEIQEAVLSNVSMELHDNIGQVLLLANINASLLQKMDDLSPRANLLIAETKKMLSTASEDISKLSRSLHSDRISEIGIYQAITNELIQLERKDLFELKIINTTDEEIFDLPASTQLMVFRMVQEILKNIIKHAHASLVEFVISKNNNILELSFEDNGIGFDDRPDQLLGNNGMGLRSLKSRANYFNGTVSIKSRINKGSRISIHIPTVLG